MRIQNNNPSMKTYRSLKRNRSAVQKNLEKLASGYQINRAADDAAGLAVSEKMRMQITGLSAALKNCRDASSLLQTAEGGLTELHEMLNRAYTLAEQSANGTYDENTDRAQLQKELEGICAEIDRIAESTNFNDIELLHTAHAEAAAENTAAAADFSNRNIASASPAEPAMLALSDAAPVNSPARARAARFSARAADTVCGDFSVSGGTLGVDYTFAGGVLTVKDGANITIRNTTGAATENRIEVADGANASITLAGVNIDLSGTGDSSNATPGTAAFQIAEGSTGNVTVTLRGDNSLKSGIGCAGLQKNGGADNIGKLTIAGDGKLTVSGGLSAAGIGGANGKEGSNILIAGGEVHAEGGDNLWLPSSWDAVPGGAGIGGGAQASGGRIEISGGTVDARGGDSAAGIGGGGDGSGSEITISGGNVTAKSLNGAGIGSGSSGADGSGGSGRNITISGGTVNASSTHGGAGIGGGEGSDCENIQITGGTVIAAGGTYGAGIGGGTGGACDGVTISAGSVTATGGEEGSGIGSGCWDSAKNITISGGTVTATGGGGAAGIGNGKDSPNGPTENTVISGGVVIATGGGTAGIQGCDALTSASGKAVVVGRGGDYTVTGSESDTIYQVLDGGTLTVGSGATLTNTSGNVINNGGTLRVEAGGTLRNDGTLSNTGTLEVNGVLENTGTLNNSGSGTVVVNGEIRNDGTFQNDGRVLKVGTGSIGGTNPAVGGTVQELAAPGAFTVTGGIIGTDYIFEDGALKILTDKAITIKNASPAATTDHIEVAAGVNANITLDGVNIDLSGRDDVAALKIADNSTGNVTITLKGENSLTGGKRCAGLQKNGDAAGTGELVITGDGKLTATGGAHDSYQGSGAGIGGDWQNAASRITIAGGDITARGGEGASGIGGGGRDGQCAGSYITISGGTVTATGGYLAAGIGGGAGSEGHHILISGGTVNATGGDAGGGIGSGRGGTAHDIEITGGDITAIGGGAGAGIGGGNASAAHHITISGGTVDATGTEGGAGIGGGFSSSYGDALCGSASNITISGGTVTANGGTGGAGIGGGGDGGAASDITISGGTVAATGGADGGAGIGGGRSCPEENDPKGTASGITISGGGVTATGGKNAPGIGGGGSGERTSFDHDPDSGQMIETITPTSGAAGTNIEISGGNVTVTGGENAAAIGSGKDGPAAGGNTISGGVVHAAGASGKTAIEGSNIHSTTSKTTVIGDQGSVTVSGNEAVDADTVYEVLSGGKLTIGSGAALTNGNVLNNGGTVEINQGGKLVNDVVLNNSGTIQVDGELINNGTINNTGTIVNNGTYKNNGTLSGNPVTGVTPDDPKLPDSCAFTVTGGVYGTDYTYENNTLKILTETALTIEGKSGVTNTDKILVAKDTDANITLKNVNIDVSATENAAAFMIEDDSTGTVTVAIEGSSILKSGKNRAGVHKNGTNGQLTIKGSGRLEAAGGFDSAGIGSTVYNAASHIRIEMDGGTVQATGGDNGAGIGAGARSSAAYIEIRSGTVIAKAGTGGAGIGGGYGGAGEHITISGGNVTAEGNTAGSGIGGGLDGAGNHITISNGVVNATGGADNAAGIGGGSGKSGTNITISGGVVTAKGNDLAAGIGGGGRATGDNITISGGIVNATGGSGGSNAAEHIGNGGWHGTSSTASVSRADALIIEGTTGKIYGDVTLTDDYTIDSSVTLDIDGNTTANRTLTVGSGVTLTNNGTININKNDALTVKGTLINNGTINNEGDFETEKGSKTENGGDFNNKSGGNATLGDDFENQDGSKMENEPGAKIELDDGKIITDDGAEFINDGEVGEKGSIIGKEPTGSGTIEKDVTVGDAKPDPPNPPVDPDTPDGPDTPGQPHEGVIRFQIGVESWETLDFQMEDMCCTSLGIYGLSIASQDGAADAIDPLKAAVNQVSDYRGYIGALQNRVDHTINNLGVMAENLTEAESRIRDTDMAAEMIKYVKSNILIQSAQAMLAQANQLPQAALRLLDSK